MPPLILAGFVLDLWADLLEEAAHQARGVADRLFARAAPKDPTPAKPVL
jgi:hypothetical protein